MARQKKVYSHHWWLDFERTYEPKPGSGSRKSGRTGGNATSADLAEKARKANVARWLKNGHLVTGSGIEEGPFR